MATPRIDIVFKQTTSERIKCKFCSKSVEGEDGYIKINSYNDNTWCNYIERYLVICKECFKHRTDEIATATEDKKASYNKMVKIKILKSLK